MVVAGLYSANLCWMVLAFRLDLEQIEDVESENQGNIILTCLAEVCDFKPAIRKFSYFASCSAFDYWERSGKNQAYDDDGG